MSVISEPPLEATENSMRTEELLIIAEDVMIGASGAVMRATTPSSELADSPLLFTARSLYDPLGLDSPVIVAGDTNPRDVHVA